MKTAAVAAVFIFTAVGNPLRKLPFLSWNASMSILSPQSARELRRIIKDSTGRDISIGEAYAIWHHLIKLLQLLWRVDNRREIPPPPQQLSLFHKPLHKRR